METPAAVLALAIPDFLHTMRAYLVRDDPRRVLWYWEQIGSYLWLHGRYPEFVECDRYALAAAEHLGANDPNESLRLRAALHAELGFACLELGEPDAAAGHIRAAAALAEVLGDPIALARALRYEATLRLQRGDFSAAEALCHRALQVVVSLDGRAPPPDGSLPVLPGRADLAIFATAPASQARAALHALLGRIANARGDGTTARRELLAALRAARGLGPARTYWSLGPLHQLGLVHERAGRTALAARYYRRCLALTSDGTNLDIRAATLLRLAHLALHAGRADEASVRARQALRLCDVTGSYAARQETVRFLGAIAAASAPPATQLPHA